MELKNETLKMVQKLLHELLFLLLLVLFVMLFSDGALPGLISSYFSFTKLIAIIFANLAALVYLNKKNNITFAAFNFRHSKSAFVLIVFSFILIGNSLLKFNYWENIIITFSLFVIFYFFHKNIFASEK